MAARKVLALFGRAEARDFADVYELARVYDATTLIARAAGLDDGFDLDVFASMLDTLARFTDNDIPVAAADVADLRSFFASWAAGLRDR